MNVQIVTLIPDFSGEALLGILAHLENLEWCKLNLLSSPRSLTICIRPALHKVPKICKNLMQSTEIEKHPAHRFCFWLYVHVPMILLHISRASEGQNMRRKDVLNSSLQLCFSLQAVARDSMTIFSQSRLDCILFYFILLLFCRDWSADNYCYHPRYHGKHPNPRIVE